MAEAVTIARPYAEAVFRLARDQNALPAWSDMLGLAASVAADPEMARLMANPNVPTRRIGDVFIGVCGDRLNAEARNLLLVLLENRRLAILPELQALYEQLRAAHERTREAVITSAFPLADIQLKAVVAKLESRFSCRIDPTVVVDPDLIGGVTIQVGDEVFDGSVRGQLQTMAVALQK